MALWRSLVAKLWCPGGNSSKKRSCPPWLEPASVGVLEKLQKITRFSPDVPDLVASLRFKPINLPKLRPRRIAYIPLIESSNFTLCLFYLPKASCLPFHDHPRQHVCLRVLQGAIRVVSCDTQQSPDANYVLGSSYPIIRSSVSTISPASHPHLVQPETDNIHEIRSLSDEDCLFLDLVVPPYGESRRITYFSRNGEQLTALTENQVSLDMDFLDIYTLIDS